jgi:hypothetical protein
VKAEMKDFKDIEVYKERINYELPELSCCQFCKYAMKKALDVDCGRFETKLECHCMENQLTFNYADNEPAP